MLTWMRQCLRAAMSRALIPAQKLHSQPPFILMIFINFNFIVHLIFFVFCIAFASVKMHLFIYFHCKCKYVIINYLYSVPKMFIFPMHFSVLETWLFNVLFFVFPMHFSVPKTCLSNAFFCHCAFSHYYNKIVYYC
ncbi:hypothetical protein AAZV13_12G081700 [Glycine max]